MLKFLQDALSAISSNIHLFLPYHKSHSMSKTTLKIHSVLHYIECIKGMGCADSHDTEIYEAAHNNLIKDGYGSSNQIDYILQILRWDMRLFHIKSRVRILLHIVRSDPLLLMADICRKLLMGDSLASFILSPSLIPPIKGVMSKCSMIATLTFPEGISIMEFFDALTSNFSTFQVDMSSSLDLETSASQSLWIHHQKMHQANGVPVPIEQHNNPDSVVVQKARYVQKWRGQGNQFPNLLIQGDWAPRNNSWVRHQGYCPGHLLYAFHFSDRLRRGEANATGSEIWWTVHHDLLLVDDLEDLSSAMTNRTHRMRISRNVLHSTWCIVYDFSVLAPMQLVPSREENQYLLKEYASLESHNRHTRWPRYVDLIRDACYAEPALIGAAFRTFSEPESMSVSHLSFTFIPAGIFQSCQSTAVLAMWIRAGIVRDYVRAMLVRATHVRVTLSVPELSETISEGTFISQIVRDCVTATLVSATLIRPGLSDHIIAALVMVEWRWIPGSVALPSSWARYRSSHDGRWLLIYKSSQEIISMCTLTLVVEHISSVHLHNVNMLCNSNSNLRPC